MIRNKSSIIGYLILVFLLFSTTLITIKLENIRKNLKKINNLPKIKVKNSVQLKEMCGNFQNRWGGESYAFYVLQPNSNFKTHKEKMISSENIKYKLPNRLKLTPKLTDSITKNKEFSVIENDKIDSLIIGNSLENSKKAIIIPIKQNGIDVGEFYVFYRKDFELANNDIDVSEAQLLTKLLY